MYATKKGSASPLYESHMAYLYILLYGGCACFSSPPSPLRSQNEYTTAPGDSLGKIHTENAFFKWFGYHQGSGRIPLPAKKLPLPQ